MRKEIIIFSTALLICNSCYKSKNTRNFDRYVFAYTYNNGHKNMPDSLELTSSICHILIYITKDNYCEVLRQKDNNVHFYKGLAKTNSADSLISKIEYLNNKLKEKYDIGGCGIETNIILENDSCFIHKCATFNSRSLFDFIFSFCAKNNLKETDTLENLLKYKYYLTNRNSYYYIKRYNASPVNDVYIHNVIRLGLMREQYDFKENR